MEYTKHLALHSGVLCRAGECLEFLDSLFSQFQSFEVGRQLVREFLTTGLDSKVFLCLGDFGFARVTVLGDQVTGEAGQVVIGYFTSTSLTQFDHFAGAGKMIPRVISRFCT